MNQQNPQDDEGNREPTGNGPAERELPTEAPMPLPPAAIEDGNSRSDSRDADPANPPVTPQNQPAAGDHSSGAVEPNQDKGTGAASPSPTLPTSTDLAQNVPGFTLIRELGRGGMGTVFLAQDNTLKRLVAIKLVTQSRCKDPTLRERFDAEVRTLASLKHPNIAQLFQADQISNDPFFVMEYVDGQTLEEYARDPVPDRTAAELLIKLGRAVEYCHEQDIIHRDLKPSNVLLDSKGEPKIADFGLAKVINVDHSSTRTGEILGTPGYMAPEQAGGVVKNIGRACDIYGLGAVLYRLITGRPPFVSSDPLQKVIQVLADDPVPPRKMNQAVSRDLETICLKCLQKKPDARYATAGDLVDDLERFLDGRPIVARPANPLQRAAKWIRRNPAHAVTLASILLAVFGTLFGLLIHNSVLSGELARSKRLSDTGSEFAQWITEKHLSALSRIGGTTDARVALMEQVSRYLQKSYADMPDDPIYTERLGYTYAQLATHLGGNARNTKGQMEQARDNYLKAIDLYDRTLKAGSNQRVVRLKIDALLSLFDTYSRIGNPEARDLALQNASRLLQSLSDSSWENDLLKAQILDRETDLLMQAGNYEQALERLDQLPALVKRLESVGQQRASDEAFNQRILILSYRGNCLLNLGRIKEAIPQFEKMASLAKSSHEADLDHVPKTERYTTALVQLGDILFSDHQAEASLKKYLEAAELTQMLAAQDPASVEAKLNLGIKLSRVATNYQYLGKFDEAHDALKKAIDSLMLLKKNNVRDVAVDQGILVYSQSQASIALARKDYDRARQLYNQHLKLCESILQKNPNELFAKNQVAENHLSQALLELGLWFTMPIDPETAESSPEFRTIQNHLQMSENAYLEISGVRPLTHDQQQQLNRVRETRALVLQALQQMKEAANPSGKKTPDTKKEDY